MSYQNLGSGLRKLAKDPCVKIVYSIHAKDRMAEYGITVPEVVSILRRGSVIDDQTEPHQDDIKLLVQGRAISDGRQFNIVVTVNDGAVRITVITVIDKTDPNNSNP